MDRLAPDLHIVWQMFSLLVCVQECVCARLCACMCAGPSYCGHPGASSTRSHNRPEFINVVHFLSSVRLQPPGCSAPRSNIPHTPLELRERPVARQGTSSGMSLLSQGERMEGGREQEVRPEGLSVVRLTSVRTAGVVGVSILKSLITTRSPAHWLILPQRCIPLAQSERIPI